MSRPVAPELWQRSYEWLWRAQALREAENDVLPAGARVQAMFDRAQLALAAATRIAQRDVRSADASAAEPQQADALALSLYREAAYWALRTATGGQQAPDLAQAFSQVSPEVMASLGLPPEVLEVTREALVARDFIASAALDSADLTRDVRAAQRFVEALLYRLGAREMRELAVLRQRVLRVAGLAAFVLVGLLAITIVPRRLEPDLAAQASWRTSSTALDYPATGKGGSAAAGETALFFHTDQQPSPWIEFDLGQQQAVHRVRLVNRADCCQERATPLVIELSADQRHWREVVRREETLHDWSTSFDRQRARYLRVRSLQPTFLHLTHVEIH